MKFGAFIMTLGRPHLLRTTLQRLLSQTRPPDHILVVDNEGSKETERIVSALSPASIAYHAMTENVGPAGAAAFALDQLSREGYEWIYWGDDDDPLPSVDALERLLKIAVAAGDDVGAIGAGGALWDWDRGEMRRLPNDALTGIVGVDLIAGNQHLILRRDAVAHVGLPDARLFFGFEEPEYCLRIRMAGYRLLVDGDLMRECRAKCGHLDWSPRRSTVPRDSYEGLWRRYYSTRNYIFTMHRTFHRRDLARRELVKAMARSCASWGRGPKYGSRFTALQLRGVIDGYLGHMGRTITPAPKYQNRA